MEGSCNLLGQPDVVAGEEGQLLGREWWGRGSLGRAYSGQLVGSLVLRVV